jgi:mannosyltransferase OCH1-like enzyme
VIPKIIWQTYECDYKDLPEYLKEYSQTFIDLNPNWQYVYHSAKQREDFVLNHFGKDWLDIFNDCPISVMRADIWRYMVAYIYGGVYSDIDSICKKPLESWTSLESDLIVCEDGDEFSYCNGAFASTAQNNIIKEILDYIKKQLIKKDYKNRYFVFHTTGTVAWSIAIKNLKNKNFYCYSGTDKFILKEDAIEQLSASVEWDKPDYVNWQKQVGDFLLNQNKGD